MGTAAYALKHRQLGLCRSCPRAVTTGSAIYCPYHLEKDHIRGRKTSKLAIQKLKSECLDHYGFLTIDHKFGKGNEHRKELFGYNISGIHMYRWIKRNNFPSGFRILCMNCNWATRYNTICPRKLER